MNDLFAIIMAGGEGTRFYPLSTPDCPKQFLNFIGEKSFIKQTYERILPLVSNDRIYISTGERYVHLVKEQLPKIPHENIIAEPLKKNTGPALVYTTALIQQRHGNVVICCVPSDHHISDEESFRSIITQAYGLANDGYLVTLGMKPTWPSTDYGYICPNKDGVNTLAADTPYREWFPVKQFTEKPKKGIANEYIKQGFLWNGGIFVWRAGTFLDQVAKYAPELIFSTSHKSQIISHEVCYQYFNNARSVSIDYALMEKSDNVAVIFTDIGWSDVGTWESIDRLMSEGVSIAPRVCAIMKGDELNPHRRIVPKPWGHEEWWAYNEKYVGKILFIKNGSCLSLQYHKVKEETIRLLSGTMDLELAEKRRHQMKEGDVYHIPPGTLHRLEAKSDCLVLEVSTPEVDDVIRINDDYGRIE